VPAYGPTQDDDKPVWETHIAAGLNRVMAVYQVGYRGDRDHEIGYAIAIAVEQAPPGDNAPSGKPWRWIEEGFVGDPNDPNGIDKPYDPTVAYDAATGNFVVAGQGSGSEHCPAHPAPILARYDPELGWLDGGWNWIVLNGDPNDPAPCCDKPWLVAGEITGDPPEQEFYICYTGLGGGVVCLRSTDGAATWRGDYVTVGGHWVYGGFPCPAVHGDGSVYLAFIANAGYQFVRGQDPDPNTPEDPMTWDYLYDSNDPNDHLEVELIANDVNGFLPHVTNHGAVEMFPQFAAAPKTDPNDPDVLYVVYHDLVEAPPDPNDPNYPEDVDVDVFLTKLRRNALTGTWAAELDRVRVNDENPLGVIADQFLPALTVDPLGRIHVIFYDDRHHEDQHDLTMNPKFDVYYAYSDDGGAHFYNARLFLDPELPPEEDPGVDFWHDVDENFEITDYIGITYRQSGVHTDIFTSFTGSSATDGDPNDPNDPYHHDDESLIWSSRILWSASP